MKTQINTNSFKISHLLAACLLPFSGFAIADTVNVYNATDLQNALKNAAAGDEIIVNPGSYTGAKGSSASGSSKAHFYSDKSGTSSNPITVRSKWKGNKQILKGESVDSGYIFYLTGDHWVIKDLKFTTAQKGIMLEGSKNNTLDNIEVFNIGAEAVHFRYFSSNNTLSNCYIHNTGKRSGQEGFGEAVYVGTHDGHTSAKLDNSNNNRIGGCSIGPNITAEAFDIKSGTKGTIIESNYINGEGIIGASGDPAADSFIDLKGTDVIIRNNKMDWQSDNNFAHGIFTYQEHRNSNIYNNEFTLGTSMPTFKLLEETVHAKNNLRVDGGTKVVEADYQLKKIDNVLDSSIEKPSKTYSCFDELTSGCGSTPTPTPEPEPEPEPTPDPETPIGPAGFTYAAEMRATVIVTGEMDIAYGASGSFNYLYNQTDNVLCNYVAFGDPLPGTVKHCYTKASASTTPTPPPTSDECSGKKTVTWNTKTEINIASTNCIKFDRDLGNETLQAWDSDTNSACNFRGEIASTDNPSVAETITANYQVVSNLSGSTFKLSPTNNCQYIKVRAY
ncbi:MAG: right-handed parallel beta-helix repeat-containing protein [Thalassotalea sp.]